MAKSLFWICCLFRPWFLCGRSDRGRCHMSLITRLGAVSRRAFGASGLRTSPIALRRKWRAEKESGAAAEAKSKMTELCLHDMRNSATMDPKRQKIRRRKRYCYMHHCLATLLIAVLTMTTVPLSPQPVAFAFALTITTFNMLASVHRSMQSDHPEGPKNGEEDWRESDRAEWWKPRAEQVARFVANELSSSDVVLLQEWWTRPEFEDLFDSYTRHLFHRVSERRPGTARRGMEREDGMAVLVKRTGNLKLCSSFKVKTGSQRIAQIVTCREKEGDKRHVIIGNSHLSFPGGPCSIANARRQAYEAHLVARAVAREGRYLSSLAECHSHLQLIAGDFNSNSCALAAQSLEQKHGFVNCMSASALQTLSTSIGGRTELGVTHLNHLGQQVCVDHIMANFIHQDGTSRQSCGEALQKMGYFDNGGTRLLNCRKRSIRLDGDDIISDHRPVTAQFVWPPRSSAAARANRRTITIQHPSLDTNTTLHFLQSYWDS